MTIMKPLKFDDYQIQKGATMDCESVVRPLAIQSLRLVYA